jgi:YbgC/YbaW family acyl-CoA thioester hydrolase
MQRSDFRFFERLRVRWAEIDAQRIVFNGHYLMYLDTAVAGYWRALGVPYAETMARFDGDLFVRKAELEYLASARYDDVLDVGIRCARVGTSSSLFLGGVFREQQLLVSGALTYVFADPHGAASKPVPRELRELFEGLRARREHGRRARRHLVGARRRRPPIRTQVFIAEQKIPATWSGTTPTTPRSTPWPTTASARRSPPGACSSTCPASRRSGGWRSPPARGTAASAAPCSRRCSARRASAASARRCFMRSSAPHPSTSGPGFVRRGPEFDEAGIAHVEMLRVL